MSRRTRQDLILLAALVTVPLAAGALGSRQAQTLRLNLGPLDSPWISGFAEEHEIREGRGVHWSETVAAVHWPVVVTGDGLQLAYRVSRVLPQTAQVEVALDGVVIDRFACRGGVWLERTAAASARSGEPLTARFAIDSHDRRGLGLLFDSVEVEVPAGGRVRLPIRWSLRGAATAGLSGLLLLVVGWERRRALAGGLVVSAACAAGFLTAPWIAVLLLRGIPEGLLVLGLPGAALLRWARTRLGFDVATLQRVGALALLAFLARGAALNHPDWYYPDLMVHARMSDRLQELGPSFFLHPAAPVDEHGAWTKPVWGGRAPLPYTVTWHAPFAALGLEYDTTLQAMKTTAAAVTTIPLIAAAAMAGSFGAPPALVAMLMLAIPAYLSRMAVALLPALLGHATDLLVLLALLRWRARLGERRVAIATAVVIGLGYLSYVSSVTNLSLFVALLAALTAALPPRRPREGLRLLLLGLAGAAIAVGLYYRDFLLPLLALPGQARGAEPVYAPMGFIELLLRRTRAFFDGVHPLLALAGLGLVLRRRGPVPFALAWLGSFLVLILLRAKLPDVFRYGHETLFVTPLVCLLSAVSLGELSGRGRTGRWLAALLAAFLVVQGAVLQWRALGEQLANAL